MNEEYRQKSADARDEQEGEATPPAGQPGEARNEPDAAKRNSDQAQQEQDRQIESGEESPG